MQTRLITSVAFFGCCSVMADDAVVELSKHLGQTPALVVVVCGADQDGLSTVTGLVERTPWTMLCRGAVSPHMDRIRDWARNNGHLGGRVSVLDDDSPSLWLAGDMADAVYIAPTVLHAPTQEEILRVLRPGGICLAAGKVLVKQNAAGVDEWRHPYYQPNNNVVSRDEVARLPGELRFQTYPVFAAMPNQTLAAGGRIFFFSGHIAFHEREEPLLNTLTVLNAYNGLTPLESSAGSEFRRPQSREVRNQQRGDFCGRAYTPSAGCGDRTGTGQDPSSG